MIKNLLGLSDVGAGDITSILDLGQEMKRKLLNDEKALTSLRGKTVVILFYENSTRTRTSFELASKYLGATVAYIAASSSSVQKGETLIDTGRTLNMMRADYIVMRHSMSGAARLLAANVPAAVINAGDGTNEHPTQALLDMLTLKERFGTLKGLKVSILGDITHSRVAKSNIFGLTKCGAEVCVFAPSTMTPPGLESLGVKRVSTKDEAIRGANCLMGLRIQLERQKGGLFPSLDEYNRFFGLTEEDIPKIGKDCIIMHPGPVNRGVELTSSIIDGCSSKINEQVMNGVCVRMSVLEHLKRR